MSFRFEFEQALVERLRLSPQPMLPQIVAAMRSVGAAEGTVQRTTQLVTELDHLHARRDRPSPPRVSTGKFHALVAAGTHILASLDGQTIPNDTSNTPAR